MTNQILELAEIVRPKLIQDGSSVYAQERNMAIKGGLNAYTIGGDNSDDVETKLGFNLGVLGHIHLSDNFGLQPEIVYSTQGGRRQCNRRFKD
ncbi:unnamed protein product [Bathycoccus prasinos]